MASSTTSTAKSGDPRLASLISPGNDGEIVIIGFPHHEGTVRNGGRAGSTAGPKAFRNFVAKMGSVINAEYNIDLSDIKITDAGDAGVSAATLEDAHDELQKMVFDVLEKGGIPFVVGGSNDQSSSNGKALLDHLDQLKKEATQQQDDHHIDDEISTTKYPSSMFVVNIDAHLDVRPRVGENKDQIHSGCPFRDLLDDPRFGDVSRKDKASFFEFAAQGAQCGAEHASYVTHNGGHILWLSNIRSAFEQDGIPAHVMFRDMLHKNAVVNHKKAVFVSFDIDSISGADCPGVSCPATIGLTADEAVHISMEAGKCPNVKLFDLSEMNPAIEDYRTPRLAVNMFYFFLLGYKMRKHNQARVKMI